MTGAAKPLAGRRILVTRSRRQAGALAAALEALGAEALSLAAIEILPPDSYASLDQALRDIRGFDWLILTSANGAVEMGGRLRKLQIPPESLAHLKVAAIGPATAAALRDLGLAAHVVPDRSTAEGVVEALGSQVAGKRVLLARAAAGRDVIPVELGRRGAEVQIATAYRTEIPSDSLDAARRLFAPRSPLPDAATFTSSSTVHNLFALLDAASIARPPELAAVSIGPITSDTLRRHGWAPAAEAVRQDVSGVVEACRLLLERPAGLPADGGA